MATTTSPQLAAVRQWDLPAELHSAPHQGLINRTWLIGSPPTAVLQWVNPVIDHRANFDIAAITRRLLDVGMTSPRLIPTIDGDVFVPAKGRRGGCWRVLSFVPGTTSDVVETTEQGFSIGRLVGRFHQNLSNWKYRYRAPPRHAHDTNQRMQSLRQALDSTADRHPLGRQCLQAGEQILARWAEIDRSLPSPNIVRNCHGDLKVSNILFDAHHQAIALIDLDTVGLMEIDSEMGDAWRSWCGTASEDDPESASFDLDMFAATASGWLSEARFVEADELRCLVPSIERICLELASRFCADALLNSYFREDRDRFSQPGEHNLQRAWTQLALAESARACRKECQQILRSFTDSAPRQLE